MRRAGLTAAAFACLGSALACTWTGEGSAPLPAPSARLQFAPSSKPRPAAPREPQTPAAAAHSPPAATPTAAKTKLAGGGSRSISGQDGVVASAEPNATRAGVLVLEQGGNAVDAAVATALALAVTHPSAGNLGGGGFLLVRPPAGPTLALDFRENAPRSLTRADFDRTIARKGTGPGAIAVPGSVAGLVHVQRRFGKIALSRVLAPAHSLARDGHVLSAAEAALLARGWPALRLDAAARRVFGDGKGKPKAAGTRLVQADLARTLERIATQGEAGFYTGDTAKAITEASGGRIGAADLSAYRAIEREPLRISYRSFELETMPPPSAGGVVLAGTLRALESLQTAALPAESSRELHLFLEVSRRAQALRRFVVSDPDALDTSARAAMLLRFLKPEQLLALPIDPAHATPSAKVHPLYPEALRELEHTTHLSVIDAGGMVVSLTTTLSASFGSKIMAPGTGVLLGNAVASFGSVGDNQPAPGKRTTSSMAPTLVLADGHTRLVLGTPGGDTIPSTLALITRRLLDHGAELDAAVDAPRLHHGFVPDNVRFEAARPLPKALQQELKALGHRLRPLWSTQGDANCALLDDGIAYAYADPREAGGLALAARPATAR
jgi:gamma-glutamyltranspeptidase/glutathione hydrolase